MDDHSERDKYPLIDSPPVPNSKQEKISLLAINRRTSSSLVIRWASICVFVLGLSVNVLPLEFRGTLGALPEYGDAPDYEAIALQLSKGNGFSIDWEDRDYQAPYQADPSGTYKYLQERHGTSPTTYRPPLFPMVMALSYKIVGRHFAFTRLVNCAFGATAGAMAFAIIASRFGMIPGFFFFILFDLVDWRARYYSRMLLTEALASLLVMLMLWCLLRVVSTRSNNWAAFLGIFTALAFLTKTMFIFLVPPIILLLFVTRPTGERWRSVASLRLSALFLVAFLVVSMPWMLRNCLLLKRFEPLGTQGGASLISGYSDRTLDLKGSWYSPAEFVATLPIQNKRAVEAELIVSDYSRAAALQWIKNNPSKVPRLAILKVISEWSPQEPLQILLLLFGSLGCLVLFLAHWRQALAFVTLPAACTLVVAATYSDAGRFLIPELPIITMLSALGIWAVIVYLLEFPFSRLIIDQR